MTPAQKIALEAKLSVQRINQLAAWLDHNRPVVGDSEAGLREALRTLLVRFDGLQHAIDTPPAIGFVGEPGSGKSQLVRALTALGEGRDGSRGRLADGEVLRNLLFHDGEVSCSAAVRFRSAASQGAQREHPFRIGLLGLADVAAIIVRVYCSGFPRARCTAPSLARIASIYEEVSRNLQAGSVPGFTDRDVYALRETLDTLYPDFEGLKLLTAAGYWNDLAEVAAHIPDADRFKVLSLLWGEQPELTRLFTELGETLARLGFVTEAFCPREALIELDPASGWMRRHSESIIDCASMARLGTAGAATLHVVGRYGQAATVTRAAMTALVADLSLTISSAPLAALKPAEIIAFPSHAPPDDLATLAASAADPYHDNGGGTPGAMQIARLYARAKAAHIFDRACQRNEVTTLVVCIDPVADHNDTLQPAIGDWIDIAQGADPYVREQRRSGLFVAAVASAGGALLGEAGMSDDLADAVAADLSWPREWTPSRPFLDVIEVGVAARASAAGARDLRGLATEPHLAGHGEDVRMIAVRGAHPAPNGANREDVSPRVTETLVRPLLDAIAPVSQTPVKQRQLRRQLGELHRRLRSRFLRFHTDGELVEWRQRIAAIIDHRLYRVVRNGKLGLLLSALMVSEAELLALYQRSLRQPFEQGMETMLGGVADIEIVEPGTDRPLKPGTPGEIVVDMKIPNIVMRKYYGMDEKTAEDFRNLKLHTGDLGRMDKNGYFYFMDRVKDYIRRRGENISSQEVERQVGNHPQIKEAACIGVKADEGASSENEVMVVCIPNGPAPDPIELIRWLANEMPYFMIPRYIRFVDELPKTPTERVQKNKLREEGNNGVTADTFDAEKSGVKVTKSGIEVKG